MELLTKSQSKALQAAFLKHDEIKDHKCLVKLFNPVGRGTWWIIDQDPKDEDYLWCVAKLFDDIGPEVGSVSLSDMQKTKGFGGLGIERDIHFKPMLVSEIMEKERAR